MSLENHSPRLSQSKEAIFDKKKSKKSQAVFLRKKNS